MILDRHVLALDVAGFAETFPENDRAGRGASGRPEVDEADNRHRTLLRTRRERPCDRSCAAEQGDELAASHSITSSARASSIAGTSRPSARAVFRLITSSYLVGCCTGRSVGFSPFRMRST